MIANLFLLLSQHCRSRHAYQLMALAGIVTVLWPALNYLGVHNAKLKLLLLGLVVLVVIVVRFRKQLQALLQQAWKSFGNKPNQDQAQTNPCINRMVLALNNLAKSELRQRFRRSNLNYALPWVLVLGEQGSGKSTLLNNSGLQFPLALNNHQQQKPGACNWWLADNAIIIAADPSSASDEQWQEFLSAWQKRRRNYACDGIVMVLDSQKLMQNDKTKLQDYAEQLRGQIHTIYQHLDCLAPIYLVIHKIDKLYGFQEFFAQQQETNMQQLFGLSLSADDKNPLAMICSNLKELSQRVHQIRLAKFKQTGIADAGYQKKIFVFPEKFAEICKLIINFSEALLRDNPYQESPRLAGIYFTSAGQFVSPLFQKIIKAKAKTLPSAKLNQRKRYWRWALSSSAAISLFFVIALVQGAYHFNETALANSLELATELGSKNEWLPKLISTLDYIEQQQHYQKQLLMRHRLGLYFANKSRIALTAILIKDMNRHFLEPVMHSLEHELQDLHQQWLRQNKTSLLLRGKNYTLLRQYLLLGLPQHVSNNDIHTLSQLWQRVVNLNHTDNISDKNLQRIVHFYISAQQKRLSHQGLNQAWPVAWNLVNSTRIDLRTSDNSLNRYAEFRYLAQQRLGNLPLARLIKPEMAVAWQSNYVLPAVFTCESWQKSIHSTIDGISQRDDNWLLTLVQALQLSNSPARKTQHFNPKEMRLKLLARYYSDYQQAWLSVINNLQITSFANLSEANQQVKRLSQKDGSLQAIIKLILDNHLSTTQGMPAEIAGEDILKGVSNLDTKGYQNNLLALNKELSALLTNETLDEAVKSYVAAVLSGHNNLAHALPASITFIQQTTATIADSKTRQAMQHLLLTPMRAVWHVLLQQAASNITHTWRQRVYPFYQHAIAHKYPLTHGKISKGNTDDLTITDLSYFIAPRSGLLWQFVSHSVQPFIDNTYTSRNRVWLGESIGFSKAFLAALQQARQLSQSLFNAADANFKVNYDVKIIPTPGIKRILFATDNQHFLYRNEPAHWQRFHWAGDELNIESQILAVPQTSTREITMDFSGTWGLFHLLEHAKLSKLRRGLYQAVWTLHQEHSKNYRIRILLRVNGEHDFIDAVFFNRLALPEIIR